MATEFEIQCAVMAGAAYFDNRTGINRFPIPDGWKRVDRKPLSESGGTGFEASAFGDQETIEASSKIVISFAGTDGFWTVDQFANLGLATGWGADQLNQAVDFYLDVLAVKPNAEIVFTGHSLGGGLAALMGSFFARQAITFDQAPFANTAELSLLHPNVAANIRQYLLDKSLTDSAQMLARDALVTKLGGFIVLRDVLGGIPNSNFVSTFRVDGEFLGALPFDAIGPATTLTHGNYVGPFDLHSQALLTTFVQNDDFRQVTFKLTDLLPMVFDSKLFYHDPNDKQNPERNLLEHLIRHQVGGVDGIPEDGDKMLARFTSDLQKLAATDGLSVAGADLTKALIAFAMQAYYSGRIATDAGKQLFETISGGIHFDRSDISNDPDLNKIKGHVQYFQNHLATLPATEQAIINQSLPNLLDWYLAGTRMTAAAQDKTAFMLGAAERDNLAGGTQNDLLVGLGGADLLSGNGGADVLIGGTGSDILFGGAGADTYVFTGGDGEDLIADWSEDGILDGGTGDDALQGGEGNDRLEGGDGMDFIDGGQGSDFILGGGTAANDGQWRAAA